MFGRDTQKLSPKIFRFSAGKVMSLAAVASLFLPLELGRVSTEATASASVSPLPVSSLDFLYADSWSQACYARNEKGVRPAFAVAKKKVAKHVAKKRRRKLFAGRARRGLPRANALDRLLKETESQSLHALNLTSPLMQIAAETLSEVPQDYDPTLRLIAELNVGETPADIAHYEETVGEYKPNDFSALETRLRTLKLGGAELDKEVAALRKIEEKKPKLIVAIKKDPVLVREASAAPSLAKLASVVSQPVATQATEEAAEEPPAPAPAPKPAKPKAIAAVAESLAKAASDAPSVVVAQHSASRNAVVPRPGGVAFGELEIDDDILDWLENRQGHIELYLHPTKSRDPQDTIFLNYQYPEEEFQIDTRGLEGEYRLMASLFAKNEKTPVAQVTHVQTVSAQNYKRKIRFRISRAVINQMSARKITHVGGVLLSATVFEGGSGDYRAPKPIAGATVSLVGLGEHPLYQADAEGNVRIDKVPAHSEVLVRVSAPGYHPTLVTIPTFEADVYSPIYLLSRTSVSAITRYFGAAAQQPSHATVLGRVFDPVKRTPKEDQQFSLSFRKTGPLYFGSLPDPALKSTSQSGLFGFFNLAPSFRSLGRGESAARSFLMNLLPDFGYYVELGRGGMGRLRAKLFDPFQGELPTAKISVVGEPDFETQTASGGFFEIPRLDLPPGVLTVEIQAEDYPRTWHTIPWNVRYQSRMRRLYMMENQIVKDGAASVAKVAQQPGKGIVVGGAETSFFKGVRHCVTVFLVSSDGKGMAKEHGPFPLDRPQASNGALCLSEKSPGFSFFNVPAGEYLLKWVNRKGFAFRTHVVRVGQDRVSVVVN
jgi:hypothetical protein